MFQTKPFLHHDSNNNSLCIRRICSSFQLRSEIQKASTNFLVPFWTQQPHVKGLAEESYTFNLRLTGTLESNDTFFLGQKKRKS